MPYKTTNVRGVRMNMNLKNKIALVTGASSGIGAAIAIKFTEEGATVAIVGRNEKKLKNISDICEKRGTKPLSIVADVSKNDDVKRIVSDTFNCYGRLDILVNNAGIGDGASILDDNAMTVFDKVMNTNLRATVFLTHLAAKHLVETKGNIINISSVAAQIVFSPNYFAYGSSKAGLDHFSRSIALELASKGVRVNVISPGPVKTDIIENTGQDSAVADFIWNKMKENTALKRIGDPEEIADLAVFLASDKARSITGSTILSDNGTQFMGVLL